MLRTFCSFERFFVVAKKESLCEEGMIVLSQTVFRVTRMCVRQFFAPSNKILRRSSFRMLLLMIPFFPAEVLVPIVQNDGSTYPQQNHKRIDIKYPN